MSKDFTEILNRFKYQYIKYVGETIYTKDICKSAWYTKISETLLTKNTIYKLNKPISAIIISNSPKEIMIQNDLLLKMTDQEKMEHSNYDVLTYLNHDKYLLVSVDEVRQATIDKILN